MGRLDDAHSLLVSVLRLGRGYVAFAERRAEPEQLLELYDGEA